MLNLFIAHLMVNVVVARSYVDTKDLYDGILAKSNPYLRPCENQDDSVSLTVEFNKITIKELDVVSSLITIKFWINLKWQDEVAQWEAGNDTTSKLYLPSNEIWTPDITVSASDLTEYENEIALVRMTRSGNALMKLKFTSSTKCDVDVEKFPLDEQTCTVTLTSTNYVQHELNVTEVELNNDDVDVSGEWDIMEVGLTSDIVEHPGGKSERFLIYLDITLKRQPLFYILNLVLPVIIISTISPFVFLVRPDSGEKVSISVTLFLSFTVFLSLLQEMLPRTSTSTSLFSLYVSLQLVLSGLSVICCVAIQRVSQMVDHTCVTKFLFFGRRSSGNNKVQEIGMDPLKSPSDLSSEMDKICFILFSVLSHSMTVGTMLYLGG